MSRRAMVSAIMVVLFSPLVRADEQLRGQPPGHTLAPFTADGCTGIPNQRIVDCCKVHDFAYWQGGTQQQRETADLTLRQCIIDKTNDIQLANNLFGGARLFGGPLSHRVFRWGRGWSYMRPYGELTATELAQVEEQKPKNVLTVATTLPTYTPLSLPALHQDYCVDKVFACLKGLGLSQEQISSHGWKSDDRSSDAASADASLRYTILAPDQKVAYRIDYGTTKVSDCNKPAQSIEDLRKLDITCKSVKVAGGER